MTASALDAPARPASNLAATLADSAAPARGVSAPRALLLTGDGDPPCGVADFTRRLAEALGAGLLPLTAGVGPAELWRSLGRAESLVLNLPLVAWKRRLLTPLLALAAARLRRRRAVVVLHEWGGLNPLRRLVLRPLVLLATDLVLLSPHVRAELAADALVGHRAAGAALAPLPPNVALPEARAPSPLSRRLAAARRQGRTVIASFGSIYPGKAPGAVLAVAAALKARGEDPLLVFLGSFVRGVERVEESFAAQVRALGLADHVVVSGYVASEAELHGLFAEVDAFLFVFPEGLTARRSSVLAAVQAGRPVIVPAPASMAEFDHHPRFRALIEAEAVRLVPPDAGPDGFAEEALRARSAPTRPLALDLKAWWGDLARAVAPLLRR